MDTTLSPLQPLLPQSLLIPPHNLLKLHPTPLPTRPPRRPEVHTTIPSHLHLLIIDILLWSLPTNRILVPEHQQAWLIHKVPVDVFEGAAAGLGVEQVDEGDEGEVQDRPDDVEFPAEGADARGGDFDYHEIARVVVSHVGFGHP